MIEFMPRSENHVVAIRLSGKLTAEDYERELIPKLDELLSKHSHVDIMFVMEDDFAGWTMEAAWDDFAYALKHRTDVQRVAVVGGPDWIRWCINATRFMMKGEIRTYSRERLESAWAWVAIPHREPTENVGA